MGVHFVNDELFSHLQKSNSYDVILSGCGMTHSDVISLGFSNLESKNQPIFISPVFTQDYQQ